MAENKQSMNEGVDRQTEEVRDLFNKLTKTSVSEVPKPTSKSVEEAIEVVTVEETVSEDAVPEIQIIYPVSADEEEPEEAEESTDNDEYVVPYTPMVVNFAPDEDDEDSIQELPPLVLTATYDVDEDEDEEDEFADFGGFVLSDDENGIEDQIDPRRMSRNPLVAFWRALCDNVPLLGDSKGEILRKTAFWLAIVVLTGALTYILYNVWWLPTFTRGMYDDIAQDYNPAQVGTAELSGTYPEGMNSAFKTLYDKNAQIRGWLSYHAQGNEDFLDIDYPVMFSGDNEKYLTVDFNGNKNKNGALFFDMRAKLDTAQDTNTSLIVYGHNMASGQMFAGLNKFIGNVNNARVASTLTMNTLFDSNQYKVFAVVITDESAAYEQYFNVRRTQFADDTEFMSYVTQLCERSLFNYPVDVIPGDELLLLSTCTVKSSAKIDDGRLTVIARKVRAGESSSVNTAAIVKNTDVIMPYAWYVVQDKAVHAYYTQGAQTGSTATTTTATSTKSTEANDTTSAVDPLSTTSTTAGTTASTTTTTTTAATTTTTTTSTTTTTTTTTTTATSTETASTTESTETSDVESETSDETSQEEPTTTSDVETE